MLKSKGFKLSRTHVEYVSVNLVIKDKEVKISNSYSKEVVQSDLRYLGSITHDDRETEETWHIAGNKFC